MSKEAEILRRCISCHDTHLCQKSSKLRGVMYLRCVSLTKSYFKCSNAFLSLPLRRLRQFQVNPIYFTDVVKTHKS